MPSTQVLNAKPNILYLFQNVLPDECIRQIPPGANICATLATAGLMFGATAASATSAEESRMDVWATTLSGRLFSLSSADADLKPL